MEYNSNIQDIAMQIIANSGEGRSKAFEALKKARTHHFDEAKELLDQAQVAISQAHQVQTQLIVDEANGQKNEFSILLVHSQDHFMTSMLAYDLICELVNMYEKIN